VGPAVGKLFQYCEEVLEHSLDITSDVDIGKPKRGVAQLLMIEIPGRITIGFVGVAVDFDDEALLRAKKVSNAIVDDVLTAELVAAKLGRSQVLPKLGFKWR